MHLYIDKSVNTKEHIELKLINFLEKNYKNTYQSHWKIKLKTRLEEGTTLQNDYKNLDLDMLR